MKKLTVLALLIFCTFTSEAQRKHLLFDSNFDDHLSLTKFPARDIYENNAQLLTDSVKRNGHKSVRIEVKLSNAVGDKGIRSEFSFLPESNPERWYGLSIFAPSNYLPDTDPESVVQWHNMPDFNLGETWISPSLSVWVQNGHWSLHTLWDTARVTKQGRWMGKLITDLGSVKLNAWTDWVFHIKFSYKSDGLVEVYRNGVKVFSRRGPNNFNDEKLPYWKVGIYKWVYKDHEPTLHKFTQRVLFYSQIRKGDEKAIYGDIAP
jgi:hypothetical protein